MGLSLLYVLDLEPLLHRQRDGKANLALLRVLFTSCPRAKVSMYVDDITVFVTHRLDIKTAKKAIVKYKQITGAKTNFEKSEGLRLGDWKSGILMLESFH